MIGIGYRKEMGDAFLNTPNFTPDFIEVAPENWMGIGGYWKQKLMRVLEQYPLFTHGLSLSIGSPDRLDRNFVKEIKQFLEDTGAQMYSEHLSFSKVENAHLFDLLPIPFTKSAVDHVVHKIQEAQDILQRPLVLENASYYTVLDAEMTEYEFINEIVKQSGCQLLLDVNNVFVNAFNHQYDAKTYIKSLPLNQVQYIHLAGHKQVAPDLIIDTHGADIIDPVYDLFAYTLTTLNRDVPVLLERDFNIPEISALQNELDQIQQIKNEVLSPEIL